MGMVNWPMQKMVKMSEEIRAKVGWGKFFREQSTLGDQEEEGKYIKKILNLNLKVVYFDCGFSVIYMKEAHQSNLRFPARAMKRSLRAIKLFWHFELPDTTIDYQEKKTYNICD